MATLVNGRYPDAEVIVTFADGWSYSKTKMEAFRLEGGFDKLKEGQPAKEAPTSSITPKKDDVKTLMAEMEVPKSVAEKALVAANGDLKVYFAALMSRSGMRRTRNRRLRGSLPRQAVDSQKSINIFYNYAYFLDMNSTPEDSTKSRPSRLWLAIPHAPSARGGSASNSPVYALSPTSTLLGRLRHTKSLGDGAIRTIVDPVHDEESNQLTPRLDSNPEGSHEHKIPKMSFSAYIPNIPTLSGLSLSRTSTNEEGRGRHAQKDGVSSRGSSAIRSLSPFHRRRSRTRDRSPSVEALRQNQSDAESDSESVGPSTRSPRNAFAERDYGSDSDEEDEENLPDQWDEQTEDNTEKNAIVPPAQNIEEILEHEPDPLGEGVNVVRPDVPLFTQQQTGAAPTTGPRRRRTMKMDALAFVTEPPNFQRDQCMIKIVHGDPTAHCIGRPIRKYLVASDLSEESKYAVEWGIGTVLKDGDELTIVTVVETESKLDTTGPTTDRLAKLRNQQDRQALANLLIRQATALLQRTRLHVVVNCLAMHAKNARHRLLDVIDLIQPIMVIVGSRGVGKLKGILLGSTSHYLIQKSSVPVMVARRRLKRAVRHPQVPHRTKHVPLAEATIEKVGQGGAEKQVQEIRDSIAKEEASRQTEGIAPTLMPTFQTEDSGLTVPATPDSETDSDESLSGADK